MARFLGVGCVFKSPMTTRTYVVSPAPQWQDLAQPARPPAHIIGVGGFGATYRVVDDRGETFAMKEYFPRDHATRGTDGRITPRRSEDGFSKKIYEEGLRRFVAEGRLLTAFSHPNVLRVVDAFDDSGTSYQLMRLVEGREQLGESDTGAARIERRVTFEDFLRELEATGVAIDLPLIRPVLKQLLDAVEYIHTEGSRKAQEITGTTTRALLHRDIKPSNILIEAPDGLRDASADDILRHADTKAILIDFGSARIFRDVQQDDVSRSIGVVTEGYAPPELKDNDIDSQGPHSDIYSIAAVIWRALTGRKPTTAQLANGAKLADLAQPIVGPDGKSRPRASMPFLHAVDRALSAGVNQRPQSVAQWRAELAGQAVPRGRKGPARKDDGGKKGGGGLVWLLAAAAAVALGAWTFWYVGGGPERAIQREAEAASGDAERAVKIAEAMATRVSEIGVQASPLIAPAEAKAKEGKAKFDRFSALPPQAIYHDAGAGDEKLGDLIHSFNYSDGSKRNLWCFKRGSAEIPPETFIAATITIDDQPWLCGTPHTHSVPAEFNEPKNPWHVHTEVYDYDGEVDDKMRPSGLGVLIFSDLIFPTTYKGRFSQDGANTTVLGGYGALEGGLGQFTGPLDGKKRKLPSSLAAFHMAEAGDAQVDTIGDRSVGVSTKDQLTHEGLDWKGGFVGSEHLPDGTKVFVSGAKQAWGRIENAGSTYFGQITDGKPDGCGVWQWRDRSKELGFYVAGARQSGELPEDCKRPHYQRPVDIDAVAKNGAQALPQ